MSKRIYVIDPRTVLQKVGGDPARIEELARRAGVNPDILQKWIAGKTQLSAEDQQRVAKALG